MTLHLGVWKEEITPQKPIALAGFASRSSVFEQIQTPIDLRTFFFKQKYSRFVILIADIIWWGNDLVEELKIEIEKEFGLSQESIILHATHNHSGPQTSEDFSYFLGKRDQQYCDDLKKKVLDSIRQAATNMEEVTIETGKTTCEMNVNRRKNINGAIYMAPNGKGPVDHEVTVIRMVTKERIIKGVFVHYACHPTTTAMNHVSSEFPGSCTTMIEERLGEGNVTGFLQGCCADVRPKLVQNERFYNGDQNDVARLGKQLGKKVLEVLENGEMKPISTAEIECKSVDILLDLEPIYSVEELHRIKKEGNQVMREWSRLLLTNKENHSRKIPLTLSLIKLSGDVSFLGMNAEMVIEYGLYLKRKYSGKVLGIPYSNGMIGYVPTAEQIKEKGYEAFDSIYYFGLPGPFTTRIEAAIYQGIDQIMQGN